MKIASKNISIFNKIRIVFSKLFIPKFISILQLVYMCVCIFLFLQKSEGEFKSKYESLSKDKILKYILTKNNNKLIK